MNDYIIANSGIIITLITSVGGIVIAILFGYMPRKRKETIEKLRKELLEIYTDAYNLKQTEERLEAEADISKIEARKGFPISTRLEKRRIENRISTLKEQLNNK